MSGWRAKLDHVLADDSTGRVAEECDRPKILDDDQIFRCNAPPLCAEELASVIATHSKQVKHVLQSRRELGLCAQPSSTIRVRHVGTFDDSKLAKFEAEMLKRFADKVQYSDRRYNSREAHMHCAAHTKRTDSER